MFEQGRGPCPHTLCRGLRPFVTGLVEALPALKRLSVQDFLGVYLPLPCSHIGNFEAVIHAPDVGAAVLFNPASRIVIP